jgi:hypothetical protein
VALFYSTSQTWSLGGKVSPARAGIAGKDCELFWSIGGIKSVKSQTPSTKLQTNLKFQYQMTETGFEFWALLFVCYLKFVIWNF